MNSQRVEGHDLSIEQGTGRVDSNGSYYVIHDSEVVGRFRTLRAATKKYLQIRSTLDTESSEVTRLSVEEMLRRQMESRSNREVIWTPEDFARVERKTRGRPKHGGGRP